MSYRKGYTPIGHHTINYITEITGNSLPLALTLSLLEVIARFYTTKYQLVSPLLSSINELIEQSCARIPKSKDFLDNFKIILDRICNLQSPYASLEFIDSFSISNSEPDPRATIFYIDIASRCLFSTLLCQKLTDSGRKDELELFFGQNDMRALDSMILNKFTNHFNIDIQVFESETKEYITNSKQGCFPLIHLFKQDYKYSLAYPAEFVQIRQDPQFDLRALENLPFLVNKRPSGPIRDPILVKEQEPNYDIKNLPVTLVKIIETLAKDLIEKKYYTSETIKILSDGMQNHEMIENIHVVKQLVNSGNASLSSIGGRRSCFICKKPMLDSELTTSHYDCSVCYNCIIDPRFNMRCPKCKGQYTADDKMKLRIP